MEIRPFCGWRYKAGADGDISSLVAPPFDVLSEQDRSDLLASSDRNIVAVDVPHFPPGEEGPDHVYADAARLLAKWQAEGVLVRDEHPALYAYEQQFQWGGKAHVRRAMICGVRATELGADVIPHEHTFAGPKADRLKLTQHTRMQLSPIFGFYRDPQAQSANVLWSAATGAPDLAGTLGDVTERLWRVDSEKTIAEIVAVLKDTPVYIADGHHRYATAAGYAAALRDEGIIDADHEANFVMFALVTRYDPGLMVLPTHRIVSGLTPDFTVPALVRRAPQFEWKRCSVADADLRDAGAFLRRYGPGAMALMGADPAEIWIAKLTDHDAMRKAAPDQTDVWRSLDVAALHKLIIDDALAPWRTDDLFVEYTPHGATVLAACHSGRARLGICLQGTPIDTVEAIADEGGSMPHKSTYFYPKVATGMVLKPLQ